MQERVWRCTYVGKYNCNSTSLFLKTVLVLDPPAAPSVEHTEWILRSVAASVHTCRALLLAVGDSFTLLVFLVAAWTRLVLFLFLFLLLLYLHFHFHFHFHPLPEEFRRMQ
jgi:hypothetical protein